MCIQRNARTFPRLVPPLGDRCREKLGQAGLPDESAISAICNLWQCQYEDSQLKSLEKLGWEARREVNAAIREFGGIRPIAVMRERICNSMALAPRTHWPSALQSSASGVKMEAMAAVLPLFMPSIHAWLPAVTAACKF